MSSTLTAARAALYWGAKLVDNQGNCYELAYILKGKGSCIFDCKLLLRSVEELTDNEKIKLTTFLCFSGEKTAKGWAKNSSIKWLKLHIDELNRDIADYLRSIHVDIDNAIADGWAVKDITNE